MGRSSTRGALWAVIGVSTLLRLAWALSLGAAYDEAYYLEYIQHLDWAYFDHPPMVALVGLPGVWLMGDAFSVLGLRLGFIALLAGSTWLMARLTTRFFGERAGVVAALILNATGYFGLAVGTFAQPDGPLLFFWLLTLDRLAVALDEPDRLGPWLGVGLAWGGAMLSKYHAVLLPAGALLYLAIRPSAWRCLRRPGPYLAVAIGLAMFTPVIAWNASHGWASFLFQGGRAAAPIQLRPDHLAAALGLETLYLFPWLLIPMAWLLVKLLRQGPRSWDQAEAFLISQALPALFLFHAVATFRQINPYWPLFGFLSLIPLMARTLAQGLDTSLIRGWLVSLAATPIMLAVVVATQVHLGLFEDGQGRILGLFAARHDPTVDLICWEQVAAELDRRGLSREPTTFFFTDSWNRSAKLALATRGKVPVTCYALEPRSFLFWSRPEDWVGRDGIFVEDDRRPGQLANYHAFFRKYEPIGSVKVVRRGAIVREVFLYRGTYQTWPFPFDGRAQKAKEKEKETQSLTAIGQTPRGSTRR